MSTESVKRPLSPHLQIYKLPMGAKLSIFHRITGFSMAMASFFLVAWLWALAYSIETYDFLMNIIAHWTGMAVLAAATFALFYHMSNGIRHLVWDMGYGFELSNARKSGMFVFVMASILTGLTWCMILSTLEIL